MTTDSPIFLLASQTKQHAAFSRCVQTRTLRQGVQHFGRKFNQEDVHFLCAGTVCLRQHLSDSDVPVLSLEHRYHVADKSPPVLLPSLSRELVLNAVTDAVMVRLGRQVFRFLLATSRDFRATVFAAAAKGIAQATQGLAQPNLEAAGAFKACEPDTFSHSQRRSPELHKMSVQWLLQKQKGKPQ